MKHVPRLNQPKQRSAKGRQHRPTTANKNLGNTRIGDRWDELVDLFHAALEQPADQVEAYCREACGGDSELLDFLTDLVRSAECGDEQLVGSISSIAQDVATHESLSGMRVGAYRIDELIGRGGMGEVYLASRADGEFDKKVAIKVVRPQFSDADFDIATRTERQALASLHHSSIPSLVDSGQLADGRAYIIFDYVNGVSLDEYCQRERLTEQQKLSLILKIAAALQHAHRNLVLHLDIKPDNILVDADGRPHLLDFGVARLFGDKGTGLRAFSPGYASPEQLRGDTPAIASDLYSLGALMYQIFAEQPPFDVPRYADSRTVLTHRSAFVQRIDAMDFLPQLPTDLRWIVRKAMAESMDERYPSVESLVRDLEHYRERRPVMARPSTLGDRAVKFVRRNVLALSLIALTFVAVIAAGLRESALRRVASQEAVASSQMADFLAGLFRVSDPNETRGNSVTARELLDRGAERIDEELSDQPMVAARLMDTMATAYDNLGIYSKAESLFEHALEVGGPEPSDNSLQAAERLRKLGAVKNTLHKLDESLPILERALAIREEQLGPDHPLVADVLVNIAHVHLRQRNFDQAEAINLRRRDIYAAASGTQNESYGRALWSLARTYSGQRRFDEAESHYHKAIEILEPALGRDNAKLYSLFQNLGVLYGRQYRYAEAEEAFQRSLSLMLPLYGSDHPGVGMALLSIGKAQIYTNKLDEAEASLRRAIPVLDEAYGREDPRSVIARAQIGQVYERRGDFAGAIREGEVARAALEPKMPPDSPFLTVIYQSLCNAYQQTDQYELAETMCVRALDILNDLPVSDQERIATTRVYASLLRATQREAQAAALDATLVE